MNLFYILFKNASLAKLLLLYNLHFSHDIHEKKESIETQILYIQLLKHIKEAGNGRKLKL